MIAIDVRVTCVSRISFVIWFSRVLSPWDIKRNSSLLLPSFGHFQSFQLCRRVCSRVAVWKDVVPCAGTVGELLQTFIFRCFC